MTNILQKPFLTVSCLILVVGHTVVVCSQSAGGYHNVNFGCELLSNEVTILGVVFRPEAQADYFHKLLV